MTTKPPTAPAPALRFAEPDGAAAYFAARLAFHTDPADVHVARESGGPGFVLVDSRSAVAWEQARIPGALHLPTADIPHRAAELLDPAVPVVVHCWGPGCDGATKAALALAQLGHQVKEMLGGIEYWIREGYPTENRNGRTRMPADPLTAPEDTVGATDCGC